jgi:ABC-type transporter Mla maintaining outer membrane lipid asymmetry ATPase subunit MlaF
VLAKTLLHKPKVPLLDEPATGLGPCFRFTANLVGMCWLNHYCLRAVTPVVASRDRGAGNNDRGWFEMLTEQEVKKQALYPFVAYITKKAE